MASGDLVLLTTAKAWMSIADSSQDAVLKSWITGASRAVVNYLSRGPTLGYRSVTEFYNGSGGQSMFLRSWPVLSLGPVLAVSPSGSTFTASTFNPPNVTLEPWTGDDTQGRQQIFTNGYCFYNGNQNFSVNYQTGYQIVAEAYVLAAPFTVLTARPWQSDQGVSYLEGNPLIYVPSGVPTIGQYTIDPTSGTYTFAAADAGKSIGITYSYIPEDLQYAVLDVMNWMFQNRNRIGVMSKTLGGQETISYSQKPWGAQTQMLLDNYRSITPV